MHTNTQHLCPRLHLCMFSIPSITNIPLPPPLFLCLSLLFISHLPFSLFLKTSSSHQGAGRFFSLNELERRQHTPTQPENQLFISLSEDTHKLLKSKSQTLIYLVLPSQTGRHSLIDPRDAWHLGLYSPIRERDYSQANTSVLQFISPHGL